MERGKRNHAETKYRLQRETKGRSGRDPDFVVGLPRHLKSCTMMAFREEIREV